MKALNPYAHAALLLQGVAWEQGRQDRASGRVRTCLVGSSARTAFAYERGYEGTKWHRSPNGQLKWEKRR